MAPLLGRTNHLLFTLSFLSHEIAERLQFLQAFPAMWQMVIHPSRSIPFDLATEKGFQALNRWAANPIRIRLILNTGLK
ncbi:hypothetical protein HRbin10_00723 [bacterium HR10]|nr:hypothetical protein HRbin10_00723 [bacterium HR10]